MRAKLFSKALFTLSLLSISCAYASVSDEDKQEARTISGQEFPLSSRNATDLNDSAVISSTLSQPSHKKRTNEDIIDALQRVKTKTLSFNDFAAFLNSDLTLSVLNLSPVRNDPNNNNDTLIGIKGIKALAKAITLNGSITDLNLADNALGNEGTRILSEAIKSNSTIKVIDLCNNNIGDEGATVIAKAIKQNTTILQIKLAVNAIGDRGAKALAKAIIQNQSLKRLDAAYNNLSDKGVTAIAEAIKRSATLNDVNLYGNAIGDEGAIVIAEAIKLSRSLTSINLAQNAVGDKGAQAFAEALKDSATVKDVNLAYNSFSEQGHHILHNLTEYKPILRLSYQAMPAIVKEIKIEASNDMQAKDSTVKEDVCNSNPLPQPQRNEASIQLDEQTLPANVVIKAMQGDAEAQFKLGEHFKKNTIATSNILAFDWYLKAANQKHVVSQARLSDIYANKDKIFENSKEIFTPILKKKDKAPMEEIILGWMYKDGFETPKDEKKACELFQKTASQGYAAAQNNLGAMFIKGSGVDKDEQKAVEWFKKAAVQEYAPAQYNMGVMCAESQVFKKDKQQAFKWFKRAAAQGYALAQNILAKNYSYEK